MRGGREDRKRTGRERARHLSREGTRNGKETKRERERRKERDKGIVAEEEKQRWRQTGRDRRR